MSETDKADDPEKAVKELPRKIRFAHSYAIDRNIQRSALAVGYTQESARAYCYKLLKDPEVQEVIEEYDKHRGIKLDIRTGDIEKLLWIVANVCADQTSPHFSPAVVVKACSELAKKTGGFDKNVYHKHSGTVKSVVGPDYEGMTDEELDKQIKEMDAIRATHKPSD